MYGALPKIEKSFDFNHTGFLTGHEYAGTFTVRCVLSIQQKHQIELDKTRLMSDLKNPTDRLDGIASAIAELKVRIMEGPAWWKDSNFGFSLIDEDVVAQLYTQCLDMENSWREELKAKASTTPGN